MPRVFTPLTQLCFSAVVDEIIQITGLMAEFGRVISALRVTLEEIHSLAYFAADMEETTQVVSSTPHIWTLPYNFKRAKYLELAGTPAMPIPLVGPGQNAQGKKIYFYQALDYYAFSGLLAGDTIKIAYYKHNQVFNYYHSLASTENPTQSQGIVPAYRDEYGIWHYLEVDGNGVSSYVTTPENLSAKEKSADWVILKYAQALIQGTLAKIYKDRGDIQRSQLSFSLYKERQNFILDQEESTPLVQL